MFSRLKPDSATMVGIVTASGVVLIYQNALPSLADIRVAPAHDEDVDATRRHAAIVSTLLIGTVFLVARDLNSYIISGAALIGIDYLYKHNNAMNPHTGKLEVPARANVDATIHPMPDYQDVQA